MSMKSFISSAAMAAVIGLSASIASAVTIDINGGTSWSGWSSVGNAQTSGVWVVGNTDRTFDIYRSSFVLSASQSVGGTRLADGAAGNGSSYTGDTASSLFSGSWQAGDRIIGIGIGYTGTSRGNTFFFHTDGGVRNILPASSFGAGDGVLTFGVGDTSSYVLTGYSDSTRGRVRQYSIFTGFSANGGNNFSAPYGLSPSESMPVRSFAVVDSGSTSSVVSIQFFINADAVRRQNSGLGNGEGDLLAASTGFGFYEAGSAGYSEQIFSMGTDTTVVPVPAALPLMVVGLGLLGFTARRRRANAS
jgi:hypothetical protein